MHGQKQLDANNKEMCMSGLKQASSSVERWCAGKQNIPDHVRAPHLVTSFSVVYMAMCKISMKNVIKDIKIHCYTSSSIEEIISMIL